MTTTDTPRTQASRTYPSYAKALWQRVLLTREFAVIALLLIVFFYSRSEIPAFDGPLTVYYLRTARGGRELYAIGSDPDAAHLYGLNVRKRVIGAFVLCGALAGLAGVVYAARYGTISSSAGTGIELQAVGAAVIGGVAIFGGSGTVWGAAIGAWLLVTINRALPILGVQDFWQRAVVGALIIAAIVLDRVLAVRRSRKLIEARDDS